MLLGRGRSLQRMCAGGQAKAKRKIYQYVARKKIKMSFVKMIPEELRHPDKKEEVILFLQPIPIRFHAKKYALLEWGEEQEVIIEFDDVVRLGGPF